MSVCMDELTFAPVATFHLDAFHLDVDKSRFVHQSLNVERCKDEIMFRFKNLAYVFIVLSVSLKNNWRELSRPGRHQEGYRRHI